MKTVLLAWELGEGYGHLTTLKPFVDKLIEQNIKTVLVVRDVVKAEEVFSKKNVTILQAPFFPESLSLKTNSIVSNYSDILALFGFDDVDSLFAMTSAWENIFQIVDPDYIIADHSPTASLAAMGRIPTAIVGNGFTVPPVHLNEFPSLRPDLQPIIPQLKILRNIREVQKKRNRYVPDVITEIVKGDDRLIFTYPDLDPYNHIRNELVHGPVGIMPKPSLITFDTNMFVYCSANYSGIEELCLGLINIKIPVSVYVRGRAKVLTSFLKTKGIKIYNKPPDLTQVLPKTSVVLSHAGSGMSHAALAAGRPQILLPRHLESSLSARALKNLGVATVIPKMTDTSLEWAVEHTCEDLKKRDHAYKCAEEAKKKEYPDGVALLLEKIIKH